RPLARSPLFPYTTLFRSRVGAALLEALAAEKAVYVVIHANHPRELTEAARQAVRSLNRAGIALLSQTVLLRGVNDNAAVLEALLDRKSTRLNSSHLGISY